jgi:Flp pilus assembly protein TadD
MSLEFTAVRALYAPPEDNASGLHALRARAVLPRVVATAMQSADARAWTARGVAALRATSFRQAHESFRRALALDSRAADALRGSTDAAAGAHASAEEAEWLKRLAAAEPDNVPVRVELSHVLAALGSTEEAVAVAIEATRIDPASAEALEQLASIFADVGDAARLAPIVGRLAERFPAREEGRYYLATSLFLHGRGADAERAIRTLLGANPRHAKGQNLLGVVCASRGDFACAKAAFEASLESNPRDPSVYVNLGYLNLERQDPSAAAGFFSEALAIDTTSEAARRGLGDARAAAAQQ